MKLAAKAAPLRPETEKVYLYMLQDYAEGMLLKEVAAKHGVPFHRVCTAFEHLRYLHGAKTLAHLLTIFFRNGKLQ